MVTPYTSKCVITYVPIKNGQFFKNVCPKSTYIFKKDLKNLEKKWSKDTVSDNLSGRKIYYICKFKNCNAKMYFHFLAHNKDIDIFLFGNHIHTKTHKIQLSKDIVVFDKMVELFFIKWNDKTFKINVFFDYFKSQWIVKKFSWFEGFDVSVPSTTNNVLESTNLQIKNFGTFRERLLIGRFLKKTLMDILARYSYERCPTNINKKDISLTPTIRRDTWIKAIEF
ncbi:hypothetical protein A3Q56_07570, partial [Intoshia linei]